MKKNQQFVGFSTFDATKARKKDWKIYDNDLIRHDLLLHFNTKKGDRIGRPDFGCRLVELVFEQQVSDIIEEIKDEVAQVLNADLRITTKSIRVIESKHAVTITAVIENNLSATVSTLQFSFDAQQGLFV